jgi:energy-coupling factor transport system permease protein
MHRLDPRAKILALTTWLVALTLTANSLLLVGALCLFIITAKASGLPARLVLGNFKPLMPVLILTLIFNMWLIEGRPIPGFGTSLSVEGVQRGVYLCLRLSVLVLGTSLLTLTTSPLSLADGIESLLRPLETVRLPVHEMALTVTIALRFIPFLADEADRIYNAQRARGADFGGSLINRARRLVPLLVPLFVSAYARADRLAVAMEARGYAGGLGRTRYRQLRMGATDLAFTAFGLLGGAGIILL